MISLSITSPQELKKIIGDRQVYLWGASIVGSGVCRALERNSIVPTAFIDSSIRFQGKKSLGYPVRLPQEILGTKSNKDCFIVIASGHYEHEIEAECQKHGFTKGVDFVSARSLCPLDPSVDISGICNLKCISCPRGNMSYRPEAGFMTFETYSSVLEKLLLELPFLGNLQLYAWGEPLLNPDAAQIIDFTVSNSVLCAISTNLNIRNDFSEVIKAKPDWIKISVSGFEKSYELTHTGGTWQVLLENMRKLNELREKYNSDMYVEVNYHLYKHNSGDDLERMRELTESLGFIFRPNHAYLYSLDNIMAYCEKKPLSQEALKTLDLLLLPLDEGLKRAHTQKHLPCAEERCFAITWNNKIRFCGAYYEPMLDFNFLESPLTDIIETRNQSNFCNKCRSLALHRFTSVYLEETVCTHPKGSHHE